MRDERKEATGRLRERFSLSLSIIYHLSIYHLSPICLDKETETCRNIETDGEGSGETHYAGYTPVLGTGPHSVIVSCLQHSHLQTRRWSSRADLELPWEEWFCLSTGRRWAILFLPLQKPLGDVWRHFGCPILGRRAHGI